MREIIKTILTEQSKDIVIKNMYQNLLDKTLSKMREKYKQCKNLFLYYYFIIKFYFIFILL